VPAVQPEALLRAVRAVRAQDLGHAGVGRGELAVLAIDVEVVGAAEVVLGAGAADGRELVVVVDVELDLALAPPARVVDPPSAVGADVLAATLDAVKDGDDVALGQRVDPAELGAEAGRVVRDVAQRVGHLVVDDAFLDAVVGQGDAGALSEGHLPVAVERPARVDAHRQRRHLRVLAPAAGEEVPERALDGRLRVVVPPHPQDLVAPSPRRRQPDVLDRP
jgi:hypothetical protein